MSSAPSVVWQLQSAYPTQNERSGRYTKANLGSIKNIYTQQDCIIKVVIPQRGKSRQLAGYSNGVSDIELESKTANSCCNFNF